MVLLTRSPHVLDRPRSLTPGCSVLPSPTLTGDVRAAVSSGQTRYADLRDGLDEDRTTLDVTLMQLARDGEVSIRPYGDVLRVEPAGD